MKDLDLLEIAGKIAYSKKVIIEDVFFVNGTDYEVMDIHNNSDGNGLNAMTLRNLATNEYVIAYQGTQDIEDFFTDAGLVSGTTPPQFEDARRYYVAMNEKFNRKVTYVCGNSLGGGLANYVAIHHKEVKSVTYNPAILPTCVETDQEYKNIKNYLSSYDPLTVLEIAAGYTNKIPGELIMTRDNIPALMFLITNHTGYAGDTNEIKIKGGNVPIRVDLLNGLPFSVFTNEFLNYGYKGSGKKIKICVASMEALKNGVSRIEDNILYAQRYLDESLRIVQTEKSHLYNRMEALGSIQDDIFKMFGVDIPKLVDDMEIELENLNPVLRTMYDIAEKINSIPVISDIFGAIVSINPVTNLLSIGPELACAAADLVDTYARLKRDGIPILFKDTDQLFDDGIPEKLKKHLEVINLNKGTMMKRVNTYELQTTGVWKTMVEADRSNFNPKQISVSAVPKMSTDMLEENKNFENIMQEKNNQLDNNYRLFSKLMHEELAETIGVVYRLLSRFSKGVYDLRGLVETIEGIAKYADIPIVSWDDDFFRDIYYNVRSVRKELDKYVYTLEGITEIFRVAKDKMGEILQAMKPYIKNAIFNDENYQSVIIYNLASYNIYESTSVTCKEIEYQLSENEAQAIQLLSSNAKIIESDMHFLMGQIKKGTIC